MCGRYVISHPREALEYFFAFSETAIRPAVRFNIAPTTMVPIVRAGEAGRELAMVRWGLVPAWAGPDPKLPLMINARCETVAEKGSFKKAFAQRRCLFPASGYYEWRKLPGGKQPFYIEREDHAPLAFAGLWEASKRPDGEPLESAAIITTAAAPEVAEIHDRMPVILPAESWVQWLSREPLSAEESGRLFTPNAKGLAHYAVRPLVNSIRNEGAELIQPEAAQERDLFS